jgi:hypothetical protein
MTENYLLGKFSHDLGGTLFNRWFWYTIVSVLTATSIYKNFSGAPATDRWYPVALANALSGTDLNGTDAEINILSNRNFPWYFGTSGEPAEDEVDLVSVVLHEVCHGLGFAGSMVKSGTLGYWGWARSDYPAAYDQHTEEGGGGSGTSLLTYGSGTSALGNALTSGDVFFTDPNV